MRSCGTLANLAQGNAHSRTFGSNAHAHCYFCMCNENIQHIPLAL